MSGRYDWKGSIRRTSSHDYQPLAASESVPDLKSLQALHASEHVAPTRAPLPPLPGRAVPYRAKKTRVMRWLILNSSGAKQQLCLDKRQLIQHFNLDIPVRDMRLLDFGAAAPQPGSVAAIPGGPHAPTGPQVSSGQLLVRDNAMLLAMEHVRMIITADKAIIPLPEDRSENFDHFLHTLEAVISDRLSEITGLVPQSGGTALTHAYPAHPGSPYGHHTHHHQHVGLVGFGKMYNGTGQGSQQQQHGASAHGGPFAAKGASYGLTDGGADPSTGADGTITPRGALSQHGTGDELAFELTCLEAGLGEVCKHLAREVDALQAFATPALEDLVSSSDRRNLEKVRRVKTIHQRLTARVSTVRDTLNKLMEDDADMFRMCLSRATQQQRNSNTGQILAPLGNPAPHQNSWGSNAYAPPLHEMPSGGPPLLVPPPAAARRSPSPPPVRLASAGTQQQTQSHPTRHSGLQSAFAAMGAQSGPTSAASSAPQDMIYPPGARRSSAGAGGLPNQDSSTWGPPEVPVRTSGTGPEVAWPSANFSRDGSSGQGVNTSLYAVGGGTGEGHGDTGQGGVPGTPGLVRHHTPSASELLPGDASMFAFGSASLRNTSMLAQVKLRHMQHMAAAAAAAAEVSRRDTGADPAIPSPSPPLPILTGPIAPPAPLLDEDDLHDVLDVENLLEAYAQMADATHTTLVGIEEYIEATEEMVNINLDYARNNLIRFELLITMGTFSLAFYGCVAGVLGENLVLPESLTKDISGFVLINGSLVIVSIIIFFALAATVQKKGGRF